MKCSRRGQVYDVMRWTGKNYSELSTFMGGPPVFSLGPQGAFVVMETSEGVGRADEGDYILKDNYGLYIPVQREQFERLYEVIP